MRRGALLGVVVIAVAVGAGDARGQCAADASSCVDCHEVQGQRPVLADPRPWHRDHGFGDLCSACHGGDGAASTQALAHAGLRAPLADPVASCAGCHAADAAERAARYAAIVADLTPSATATDGDDAGRAATTPSAATPRPRPHGSDRALAAIAIVLAGALAGLIARRRGRRPALIAWLRAPRWSAYTAGAGLGLVVAIAEAGFGRPVSASGAFDKLAAYAGRALFPDAPYYRYVMQPGLGWPVWIVLGVVVGAFASSRLAGDAHVRWLPDAVWVPRFGPSRVRRAAIAFGGAALVQLGAGIAGGCTSGLAISGGALLAPAAYLFMAAMFATGIPTAWWWYRRSDP